ncbi:hypothetical protein EB001_17125 [bacterium]|nr:hypothetical protein [bacterium]
MSIKDGPNQVMSSLDLDIDFANIKTISGSNILDLSANGYTVQTMNSSSNSATIANGYCTFNPATLSGAATFYRITASGFVTSYSEISLETCVYTTSDITAGSWQRNRPISPRTGFYGSPLGFALGNAVLSAEYQGIGTGNVGQDVNGYYGAYFNSNDIGNGKWIHIIQTLSTTLKEYKTYINGNLTLNIAANSAPANFTGIDIGKAYYDVECNYMGRVAFLKVYKKALSLSEVMQNFNARRGRFGL